MRALPNMKPVYESERFFREGSEYPLEVTAAYALLVMKIFCSKHIKEKDLSILGIQQSINQFEEMSRKAIVLRFGLNGTLPKSYREVAESLMVSSWKARKYVLNTLENLRNIQVMCSYSKTFENLKMRSALSYDPNKEIKALVFLGLLKKSTAKALIRNKVYFIGQLVSKAEQSILDSEVLSTEEKQNTLTCKVILDMLVEDYKCDFYDEVYCAYRAGKITHNSCDVLKNINIITMGQLDMVDEKLILGLINISDEEKTGIINLKAEIQGRLQKFSYTPTETIKRACYAHVITGQSLYYLKKIGVKTLADLIEIEDDKIRKLKYTYEGKQELLKFKRKVIGKIVQ